MALSIDQLVDVAATTLADLDKGKWTDISHNTTDFVGWRWMNEHKRTGATGDTTNINYRYNNHGNVRAIGPFSDDVTSVADMAVVGTVPHRAFTGNWSIDELEIAMNASEEKIIDLMRMREAGMWVDMANTVDGWMGSKPTDSTDALTPYGFFYWAKWNATTGFNGGAVAGFTSGPAGISPTTYPYHKNWTADYAAVSKTDLLPKMREGYVKSKFRSPLKGNMTGGRTMGEGKRCEYYAPYSVIQTMETIAESQNENLGNDLASKDGMVLVRGVPVERWEQLESKTGTPIIGIDWSKNYFNTLNGFDMRTKSQASPRQHLVVNRHVTHACNWICTDRRSLQLYATDDPYA